MLTLRPSTVPLYLRSSQKYQYLDHHADEEFEVPKTKFKADLKLESVSDLSLLFNTLDFWACNECYVEVVEYVYNRLSKANLKKICDKYGHNVRHRYINLLKDVREGRGGHPVNQALFLGYAPIAVFMKRSGYELNEHSEVCALASMRIECVRFVLQERQAMYLNLPPDENLSSAESSAIFHKRTVFILASDVPSYLHNSELYKALDHESGDVFEVPILNYKLDLSIGSTVDLVFLLDTLDYWGSDEIFPEVLFFIYDTYKHLRPLETEPHFIHQNYAHRLKYVGILLTVVGRKEPGAQMKVALESGNVRLISFLREQGLQLDDMSIQYAIRSQNPGCIQYVTDNKQSILPVPVDSETLFFRRLHFSPAQAVDINVIRSCIAGKLKDVMTVEFCMIAAKAGNLEVLQQLHELRCPWDVTCCTEAAAQGHLHCLTYAHEQGAPWDAGTCGAAAKNKHMECLTYLIENSCPVDGAVSRAAIANCDLEMLIFAHENLLPWEDDMCMLAALAGSLPCLKYLHEAGCELTSETCAAAGGGPGPGRLECLKYAHENGAPWTVSTTIAAAKSYNISGLQYAHQNGCPIDKRVCIGAIKVNCSRIMVRYMGENKFPFDANMCRLAAKQGSDHIVQFLHIYGCPWSVTTTRDAAAGGHIDALKYAAERGCPVAPITCSFGVYCDENSPHFECMKYIFDNHDQTFDSISAITRGHFACFRYAHDHGAPWSKDIVVTAARMGKVDYLKYAFEEGNCPFYTNFQSVYDAAVESKHIECIEYLNALRGLKCRRVKRLLLRKRRNVRINGWMQVRRVSIRNKFTENAIICRRLPANRFCIINA